MSAQQYSVIVKCDSCDEVVSQSGKQREDANVALLRSRIYNLGWKTTSEPVHGKLSTRDYCPVCSGDHS
jgi:hypothetical protein